MTGKVYIANISSSLATYYVNSTRIEIPARPMNERTLVPYFVIVARTLYPDPPGTFAVGSNEFRATFADKVPPEPGQIVCVVNIPNYISLDDDLILYVFRNSASLLTTRGVVIPGGSCGHSAHA